MCVCADHARCVCATIRINITDTQHTRRTYAKCYVRTYVSACTLWGAGNGVTKMAHPHTEHNTTTQTKRGAKKSPIVLFMCSTVMCCILCVCCTHVWCMFLMGSDTTRYEQWGSEIYTRNAIGYVYYSSCNLAV